MSFWVPVFIYIYIYTDCTYNILKATEWHKNRVHSTFQSYYQTKTNKCIATANILTSPLLRWTLARASWQLQAATATLSPSLLDSLFPTLTSGKQKIINNMHVHVQVWLTITCTVFCPGMLDS